MAHLIREMDWAYADLLERVARDGKPVTCPSCQEASCCYQVVVISIGHALFIANRHPVPRAQWPRLVQLGQEMIDTPREEFFLQKRRPCIYLHDNRCTIYQDRPNACRAYYVASPKELCRPDASQTVRILQAMDGEAFWTEKMLLIQEGLGLPPRPPAYGPLPLMIAIAAEALEQPSRKAFERFLLRQKWPGVRHGRFVPVANLVANLTDRSPLCTTPR